MQRKVLSEVVDYLHKAYPDASIGVGGSVAIGTYRADSDVDILFQQEDCHKNFLVSFPIEELRSVFLDLVEMVCVGASSDF